MPVNLMRKRILILPLIIYFVFQSLTAQAHGGMRAVYDLTGEVHRYKVLCGEQADYYVSRGWSETPEAYDTDKYTIMYSDDGRILYTPVEDSEANSTVGWYYSPRLRMYSWDGRTNTVSFDDIAANELVGWYIEPTAMVSSEANGTRCIIQSEIDDYRQNGWYIKQYSKGLNSLKSEIQKYIDGLSGSWGVYVKNLNTGDYLILNDGRYSSASIIKLFVMADVYNEIAYGGFEKDRQTQNLLTKMITVSDNYSSNQLVKKIGRGSYKAGFDAENAHTVSAGCFNTRHNSLFIGYGDYVSYGRNVVSPLDCGIMLEKIYNGELVSAEYSAEMLDLLKNQQRRSKIPYPLPAGTVTANKTGETSTVESDVGIVYSPSCDYIICVLSNRSSDGVQGIRKISRMVYDYLQ